jgi:hypothetical protein
MAAQAIQMSITHTAIGIALGSGIEAVMPPHSASASISEIVFEVFVQMGLNGVALSQVGTVMMDADPTYGLPFSLALFEAQPALRKRIDLLASVVKQRVSQLALKMVSPVVAAAPSTPSY